MYEWALGDILGVTPEADAHYRKALSMDSSFVEAYESLAVDASAHGEDADAHHDWEQLARLDPNSTAFAVNAAVTLDYKGRDSLFNALIEVGRRLLNARAFALQTLLSYMGGVSGQIAVYERWFAVFPEERGSRGEPLFDLYGITNPERALAFGRDMAQHAAADSTTLPAGTTRATIDSLADSLRTVWTKRVEWLTHYANAQTLLGQHQYTEASAQLDAFHVDSNSVFISPVAITRARILDGLGSTQAAYDSMVRYIANRPNDSLVATAIQLGEKLGKGPSQVDADIVALRAAKAPMAALFTFPSYTSDHPISLADFRGKVVLITFWNPACGPCRMEFPRLDSLYDKYKAKGIVYLGINVSPEQNAYVMPFIKQRHLSFTPLSGDLDWASKHYGVVVLPGNFVIDPQGRIVYSHFYAGDADAQRSLDLVLEELFESGRSEIRSSATAYRGVPWNPNNHWVSVVVQ
jgi:peroxiredoxin